MRRWLLLLVMVLVGGALGGRADALSEPTVSLAVVGGPFSTGDTLTVDVTISNPDPDDVLVYFILRLDGSYSPAPPLGGWAVGTPDGAFIGFCDPPARQVPTFEQILTCEGTVLGGTTSTVRVTTPVRLSACAPEAYPVRLSWTWADPMLPDSRITGPERAAVVPLRPAETCAFAVAKRAEPPTVSRGDWATWVISFTNLGDPYWLRNDGRPMVLLVDSFDREAFEEVELVEAPAGWECAPTAEPYDGGAPPPFDVVPPGLAVPCAASMNQEFLLESGEGVTITYRARVPAGGPCLPESQATNQAFTFNGDLWGTPDLDLDPDPQSWRSDEAPVTILGTDDDPSCNPAEDRPGPPPAPPEEPAEPITAQPRQRLAWTGSSPGPATAGFVVLLVGASLVATGRRRSGRARRLEGGW